MNTYNVKTSTGLAVTLNKEGGEWVMYKDETKIGTIEDRQAAQMIEAAYGKKAARAACPMVGFHA